jgi:hypothetical protein
MKIVPICRPCWDERYQGEPELHSAPYSWSGEEEEPALYDREFCHYCGRELVAESRIYIDSSLTPKTPSG